MSDAAFLRAYTVLGRIFAVLPLEADGEGGGDLVRGAGSTAYSALYCLAVVALGIYHGIVNYTATDSPTETYGSLIRSFVDVLVGATFVAAGMTNAAKLPGIIKAMKKVDVALCFDGSKSRGTKWRVGLYSMYAAFAVAYSAFAQYMTGALTCKPERHDRLGLGTFVPCEITALANGVFSILAEAPMAVTSLLFVFLVLSIRDRVASFQEHLRTLLHDDITDKKLLPSAENIERMRHLYEDVTSLVDKVTSMHSPQLVLLCFYLFVAGLTNTFFGLLTLQSCVRQIIEVGMPLLLWAAIIILTLFLVVDSCQALTNQIGETGGILRRARTARLNPEAARQVHIFASSASSATSAVSASDYLTLNRDFFVNFLNTVVTYLIIMIQFDLGTEKQCPFDENETY